MSFIPFPLSATKQNIGLLTDEEDKSRQDELQNRMDYAEEIETDLPTNFKHLKDQPAMMQSL